MQKEKHRLSNMNRTQLRKLRKGCRLAAEDISLELGYSKAWLGQLERGDLKTAKKKDLAYLLARYYPLRCKNIEYVISSGILQNFLEYGIIIESADDQYIELSKKEYTDIFYKCIEQSITDEKKDQMLSQINAFLNCVNEFPNVMSLLLSNSETLYNILSRYSELSNDQFLSVVNDFTSKLNNIIQTEDEISKTRITPPSK